MRDDRATALSANAMARRRALMRMGLAVAAYATPTVLTLSAAQARQGRGGDGDRDESDNDSNGGDDSDNGANGGGNTGRNSPASAPSAPSSPDAGSSNSGSSGGGGIGGSATSGSSASVAGTNQNSASVDQYGAQEAVRLGKARKLKDVIAVVNNTNPGAIVSVKLRTRGESLIYDIKVLTKTNSLKTVSVNANTLSIY